MQVDRNEDIVCLDNGGEPMVRMLEVARWPNFNSMQLLKFNRIFNLNKN